MRRSWRGELRCDQLFSGPDASQRIEPVREGLPKNDNVRRDSQVLHRPEFAGAIESHLDLIVYDQNVAPAARLLQSCEVFPGWNDISSGSLDRLDVECAVLRCLRFGIPDRM